MNRKTSRKLNLALRDETFISEVTVKTVLTTRFAICLPGGRTEDGLLLTVTWGLVLKQLVIEQPASLRLKDFRGFGVSSPRKHGISMTPEILFDLLNIC